MVIRIAEEAGGSCDRNGIKYIQGVNMVGDKNMDINEQNSHKVLAVNKIPLFRDLNNITRAG